MSRIVEPIVARLKTPAVISGARAVEGVAALKDVLNGMKGSFELFVMRTSDRAAPSTSGTMVTRQMATTAFEIVCAFSMAHLRGTPNLIDDASAEIIGRIQGWVHPAGDDPTEYRGARNLLSDYERGLLLWALAFDFTRTIEG